MAIVDINPEVVLKTGERIMENAAEYKKEIDKIYNTVGILKNSWTGVASESFVSKLDEVKDDYENFGQLIGEFGRLLADIGKSYQNLENNLK